MLSCKKTKLGIQCLWPSNICFGGGLSGCAGVEASSSPGFVGDSEDIGRRCPVNLYDSYPVRDELGGEIVDHYSPLALLVLCGKQARSVSVYMHRRHVFHEAALIIFNFQVATTFRLSRLQTVPCCFLTSRASRSRPLTRSDTHVWDIIRFSMSNSRASPLVKLAWWRSPRKHAAVGYHQSHPPFVLMLHRCYIGIICAFNLSVLTGP